MFNYFDFSLQFLSKNALFSFFIYIVLVVVFAPLLKSLSEKLSRKWNLSNNNYGSFQVILTGVIFLTVTLGIYAFSKKLIFGWILASASAIIGGTLGFIPFSFLNKKSSKGKKGVNNLSVKLDDIPLIVSSLQKTGSDGSFALFIFSGRGYAPGLQYSIEKGNLGIDYLLNSKFNKEKEEDFIKIISNMGYKFEKLEENDVPYIRIEGDSLVKNGQDLLKRIYQVKDNQEIDAVLKGFSYT